MTRPTDDPDTTRLVRAAVTNAMRTACFALAKELYASWRVQCAVHAEARKEGLIVSDPEEPRLTVSFVRGYLAQASRVGEAEVPEEFAHALTKRQADMVRRALEALVREGKLTVSTGPGRHRNGEARCYNPRSV